MCLFGTSTKLHCESASICVLDTEWRSRLFPCRNSKRPSPVFLDYGRAAAMFAAAFPRRRLRFAFSRFRLRCAFGGSVALPLVGSARFLLLCRPCLRSFSCPPRCWSLALLLWFWRCRLWVTCPSLHGRLILAVTSSRLVRDVVPRLRVRVFVGDCLQ